jgi:hypothetical protein
VELNDQAFKIYKLGKVIERRIRQNGIGAYFLGSMGEQVE